MCGDYRIPEPEWAQAMGSPPRVRGLLVTGYIAPDSLRITPACAGTTHPRESSPRFHRDHPRVCGDYNGELLFVPSPSGSPPRVRGLPHTRARMGTSHGITPACAGTTWATRSRRPGTRDHPRVCGDYHVSAFAATSLPRITPACAGTTDRLAGVVVHHVDGGVKIDVDAIAGITPACAGTTGSF